MGAGLAIYNGGSIKYKRKREETSAINLVKESVPQDEGLAPIDSTGA